MQYYIKITGSGTKEDIMEALGCICQSLMDATPEELDGAKWEDPTLFTEVNHD